MSPAASAKKQRQVDHAIRYLLASFESRLDVIEAKLNTLEAKRAKARS